MERTKQSKFRKADGILCADIHLQEGDAPICRLDDFEETQWRKLDWLSDLQKKHDCAVIHSGDLFDYWKPSPELLTKTIEHIPKRFLSVYGNHDLPQHNMKLVHKCGQHMLQKGGHLNIIENMGNWLVPPETYDDIYPSKLSGRSFFVWHVMTYKGKEPWPGCTAPKGSKLLRKYPQYDLIVTGDNHKPFTEEYEGRLLVNPGSLFRREADQANHRPRVYLWYADTNTVEACYVPIEEGVISREHIEVTEERDDRIDAFISTLSEDWDAGMSLEENLKIFQQAHNTREAVMEIIYAAIE